MDTKKTFGPRKVTHRFEHIECSKKKGEINNG